MEPAPDPQAASALPREDSAPQGLVPLDQLWVAVEAMLRSGLPPSVTQELEQVEAILRRDLLADGSQGHVVIGFMGPNNAGKSAVFNGLVGATVSPSRATGGATRRLLGACRSPETIDARGFAVERAVAGPEGVLDVLTPGPREGLLVVPVDHVPDPWLIVDAPDFDSVSEGHVSMARDLLWVTDLAILVVTRHTYQNLAVVEFLREWLQAGHPYLIVYNEAPSAATAWAHARVLEQSFGQPAQAIFAAAWDQEVAEGRRPLLPKRLNEGSFLEETLGAWISQVFAAQ